MSFTCPALSQAESLGVVSVALTTTLGMDLTKPHTLAHQYVVNNTAHRNIGHVTKKEEHVYPLVFLLMSNSNNNPILVRKGQR